MIADTISAIHRFVTRWLKRKFGDGLATIGTSQIHAEHLLRSTWAAGETSAGTTITRSAEGAIAFIAIHRAITGWLKRQLRNVGPAFGAGKIHIVHLPIVSKRHNVFFVFSKMLFGAII